MTIGFTAVTRLLSGRVDAAPVFWNAEGIVLRRRGVGIREFRVEDHGAPEYPELVLVTSRETLGERREEIAAALADVEAGIEAVRGDPDAATRRIAQAAETEDTGLIRAQLDAVLPRFAMRLDRDRLEAWAAFDARIGIVDEPPDVARAFEFGLAP